MTAPARPDVNSSLLARALCLIYGTVAYTILVGTFVYAIGFLGRFIVPKHVNSGGSVPLLSAVVIDLVLMGVFAVQHSVMARKDFKRVLADLVSPVIVRSTHVLCSSLVLIGIFTFWQPIRVIVWHVDNLALAFVVQLASVLGWLLVLHSTSLIGHFELFGLKQVAMNFIGRAGPGTSYATPDFYRFVRHPLCFGFLIAIWATPTMTVGNLLFVAVATAYIVIALEKRALSATFGAWYRQNKMRVATLLPGVF